MQKQLCRKKSLFAALSVEHFHGRKTPGLVQMYSQKQPVLSLCLFVYTSFDSIFSEKQRREKNRFATSIFYVLKKKRERERERERKADE
jgi:hypothetical protein